MGVGYIAQQKKKRVFKTVALSTAAVDTVLPETIGEMGENIFQPQADFALVHHLRGQSLKDCFENASFNVRW